MGRAGTASPESSRASVSLRSRGSGDGSGSSSVWWRVSQLPESSVNSASGVRMA